MSIYDTLEYADSDSSVKEIYDDIFEHLGNAGLVDYFKVLGKYFSNTTFGTTRSHTVLSGTRALWQGSIWPLAFPVGLASVVLPFCLIITTVQQRVP